jgi:hypothetical protein
MYERILPLMSPRAAITMPASPMTSINRRQVERHFKRCSLHLPRVMRHSIIRLNIEHYEGFSRLTEGLVLDRVSGVDDGSPLVIEGSSWGAGIKFFCVSTVGIVCADRSSEKWRRGRFGTTDDTDGADGAAVFKSCSSFCPSKRYAWLCASVPSILGRAGIPRSQCAHPDHSRARSTFPAKCNLDVQHAKKGLRTP